MKNFVRLVMLLAVVVGLLGCNVDDNGTNPGGGVGWNNTCGTDGTAGSCKTVVIGGQTWLAENLNYQTGTSWCYKDSASLCKKYGRLYDWETAKMACPSGWHLPTSDEWDALVTAAGGNTAGKKLKSTSGWNKNNNGNGTNDFGFSALPGGGHYSEGGNFGFSYAGYLGNWWTATEIRSNIANFRRMDYSTDGVGDYSDGKSAGWSVRCVAD